MTGATTRRRGFKRPPAAAGRRRYARGIRRRGPPETGKESASNPTAMKELRPASADPMRRSNDDLSAHVFTADFGSVSRKSAGACFSSPAAIGRDALVGDPHAVGKLAALPEHVDRDSAAREPVAADPEPARLQEADEILADPDRAILVKGPVIPEARQIELQRLRLEDPFVWRVVDDQMGEIGLAGDRADGREFRRGEARDVIRVANADSAPGRGSWRPALRECATADRGGRRRVRVSCSSAPLDRPLFRPQAIVRSGRLASRGRLAGRLGKWQRYPCFRRSREFEFPAPRKNSLLGRVGNFGGKTWNY